MSPSKQEILCGLVSQKRARPVSEIRPYACEELPQNEVVSRSGPVAFPSMPQPRGPIPRGRIRLRPGQLHGVAVPVKDLATVLSDVFAHQNGQGGLRHALPMA